MRKIADRIGKRKLISLFRRNKTSSLLGLDVSSTSVKLLELSKAAGRYTVESYGIAILPDGAVVEKNITDIEGVGETIHRVLQSSNTKNKQAAVAVSGSAVIIKNIQMDASLNENDMEQQIIAEADQYIPYALDEVAIDFDVLGPAKDNEEQAEVLLAACRKENVDNRIEALNQAGLTPKVVDIEAYAIERSYQLVKKHHNLNDDQVVAVVDIGSTMTTLNIFHGGVSVYTREQLFGGKKLTQEIQSRYAMTMAEAGLAKKQGGLPEDCEEKVLAPFRESVVQQITRALQFCFSATQYNDIDFAILAGGVAAMDGLANKVQESLGVSVAVANPFAEMDIAAKVDASALQSDASALMIACGLAMRGLE